GNLQAHDQVFAVRGSVEECSVGCGSIRARWGDREFTGFTRDGPIFFGRPSARRPNRERPGDRPTDASVKIAMCRQERASETPRRTLNCCSGILAAVAQRERSQRDQRWWMPLTERRQPALQPNL